jgi:hypothetical protein
LGIYRLNKGLILLNLPKHTQSMVFRKIVLLTAVVGAFFSFNACHSDKGSPANHAISEVMGNDTSSPTRKVSVVISSIPFPSGILDTLESVNGKFQPDLPNAVTSVNLYSESNAQAANLGIYGADLAYVISYEQFQSVGVYMKATKFLADNIDIPLAFTQSVIERCEKNQNNKDSLSAIVFQSYSVIDRTLKQDQKDACEALVLTGGWIEGVYLTTQSLAGVQQSTDKKKVYHAILQQKIYAEKLLKLLTEVKNYSWYCRDIFTPMQDIKTTFDAVPEEQSITDESLKALADKVKDLRTNMVKGAYTAK